ncbi:hypothetical protein L1285_21060 [Pseudoalteromonas sp. DL2-H2.2]|uniref:hypothetical protein n=1 Tax=Pseudoalteromonas sp. DL2-H2.2 TaxID=2908889 RepID=UPI001F350E03|nr:hypothetical protein [Pseudoalteromonas sp. DL2-H2.2]MCF2910802.1 hypothetical protein [Pseudoalteromonas sp. DL2-H2.2]
MPTPVTVYRWDDPGAPQITTGAAKEWFAILKQCLVEGYGDKQPLGWTVVNEVNDPPHLCLQNNTDQGASGGYVMLDAANNNGSGNVIIVSALDYSDESTHSRLGRANVFSAFRSSGTYQCKNWLVIATHYGFYLFASTDHLAASNYLNRKYIVFFYCGDYIPVIQNDPCRFVALTGSQGSPTGSRSYNETLIRTIQYSDPDYASYAVENIYAFDSTASSAGQPLYMMSMFGKNTRGSSNLFDTEPDITLLSPFYLFAGGWEKSDADNNATLSPHVRGQVPGLWVSPQTGFGNKSMPFIKSLSGINYLSIPCTENTAGIVAWLNLEEW